MLFKYIYEFYLKILVYFDTKYFYLKILIILFIILYLISRQNKL